MDTPVQPTGVIVQLPTPDMPGSLEVRTSPSESTATQRSVPGQDKASMPTAPSTSEAAQAEAPPAGSVAVRTSPVTVTATQRLAFGHDSAEISLGTPYLGTGFTAVTAHERDSAEAADAEPGINRIAENAIAVSATALRLRALLTFGTVMPIGGGHALCKLKIATKRLAPYRRRKGGAVSVSRS
jgi:hypothetical protein